jgi:hypothetical protein
LKHLKHAWPMLAVMVGTRCPRSILLVGVKVHIPNLCNSEEFVPVRQETLEIIKENKPLRKSSVLASKVVGLQLEISFMWQVEGWVSALVQPFRSAFIAQSHDSIYDPHEPQTHAIHQADFSYLDVCNEVSIKKYLGTGISSMC